MCQGYQSVCKTPWLKYRLGSYHGFGIQKCAIFYTIYIFLNNHLYLYQYRTDKAVIKTSDSTLRKTFSPRGLLEFLTSKYLKIMIKEQGIDIVSELLCSWETVMKSQNGILNVLPSSWTGYLSILVVCTVFTIVHYYLYRPLNFVYVSI